MREFAQGQPLKLEKPGVKDRLLQALDKGSSYRLACGFAGIAFWTFSRWMKRGEEYLVNNSTDDGEPDYETGDAYYKLYCDVKRVESQAALKWLIKIDEAASNGHWQAAAWKLERRYPKDYGRVEKESKDKNEDESLEQAKSEVIRLKRDEHERSSESSS